MNALLSLFVIVFNLSLVFLIQTGIHSLFGLNMFAPWIIAIVALFILWIYLNLININHISPHYFFRDRVGDVFLKTAVTNSEGEIITARDQSQVKLTEINPDGCSAPYHIVVGAINLPGSYDRCDLV